MKFVYCLVVVIAFIGGFVQKIHAQKPYKEVVIVDPFVESRGVEPSVCDGVRNGVMSKLSKLGNLEIVDPLVDARLSKLYVNRKIEDVINDTNWKTESEVIYKSMSATKLLRVQIDSYSVQDINALSKKSIMGGIAVHIVKLNFTLSVYNIADGTLIGSESFNGRVISEMSSEPSFNKIFEKASKDMNTFFGKYFKVKTYVLELGDVDKKGVIKYFWTLGGANIGIVKGMVFQVLLEKKIGSNVIYQPIDFVVAKEVHETTARCELSNAKMSMVVRDAFGANKKIYVEAVSK